MIVFRLIPKFLFWHLGCFKSGRHLVLLFSFWCSLLGSEIMDRSPESFGQTGNLSERLCCNLISDVFKFGPVCERLLYLLGVSVVCLIIDNG